MKKGVKYGLLGLVAGGAAAGGLAALGNTLYQQIMVPTPRDPAREATDPPALQEGRSWARRAEGFRTAVLQSVDGLTLWAAHLPAKEETHRWAICLHGFRDDHTSVSLQARHYHEQGFHVLMPDQRGFGHSEGNHVGWGFDERLDLISWISWIVRRDAQAEILLHGVSMGGATVLMATGGPLPQNVKAAVSDCSYASIEGEIHHVIDRYRANDSRIPPVPNSVLYAFFRKVVLRKAGFDLKDASPVEAVSRSETPTLFIHGTKDETVPPVMLPKLVQAAKCPKRCLWVPDAGHAVSVCCEPRLYWSAVDAFIEEYF